MSNLDKYLDRKVSELVAPPEVAAKDQEQERHRINCSLLMACTRYSWNGNKNGHGGKYPLNPSREQGATAPFLDSTRYAKAGAERRTIDGPSACSASLGAGPIRYYSSASIKYKSESPPRSETMSSCRPSGCQMG
jgi:hypothetical protein